MANSQLPIVEPLHFHRIHGEQIRLSENHSRATRDRLNNTLVFTNRPVLSYETIQFLIEEVSTDYYGLIRIGLTTIDPDSFTRETLPKAMPTNEPQQWFVPTPRGSINIEKNGMIRLRYTSEGDIHVDYNGIEFAKGSTASPITKDVWCALDLNGVVAQIRIVQNESRVLPNPVERARARYIQYTNNRQDENLSIYYSGELSDGTVTMKNCDQNCELSDNIAVKKNNSASITIDENLKRGMYVVMQILDMDHTLPSYLTIRCLINGQSSDKHSKLIDTTSAHITLGDELGVRVLRDGQIAFSCNNRNVKTLFNIDLTVNDHSQVKETSYRLDFLLNGRVTGIRLVGLHHPTEEESKAPPAVGGGCLATVIHRVCPNAVSGLLLPCKHLCVCYECGQALINRHSCPNARCRKPVVGCVKVYKD
jgi:hypothetical protein